MRSHQEILNNFQYAYDSQCDESLEPTELDKHKEKLQVLADEIEKELIEDKDQIFFIIRNYLHQAVTEGIDDEIADCFSSAVELALNHPFMDRDKPFNRFVKAAYRWEAEQQAIKEIDGGYNE